MEPVTSTHRADIVSVVLEPHPNADSLSIVKIYDGGFQVIVKTADWIGVDRGVYIQPDSIVPDAPEYAFLEKRRIRAKKLRGEWSAGLLMPVPAGLNHKEIGDDLAPLMGIEHYDPPPSTPNLTGGLCDSSPKFIRKKRKDGKFDAEFIGFEYPKYDVESFRKYGKRVYEPGELIWITEKIHGSNGRWLFDGKRFYCGSRTEWKKEDPQNLWWRALNYYPTLQEFLQKFPGVAVYGEVYGQVQDLKYGVPPSEIRVAVFDILREGKWINALEAWQLGKDYGLPWVPLLMGATYDSLPDEELLPRFDFDMLIEMAEGPSQIPDANHIREGIVVKPWDERWHPKMQGRVCTKIVGNGYWARK